MNTSIDFLSKGIRNIFDNIVLNVIVTLIFGNAVMLPLAVWLTGSSSAENLPLLARWGVLAATVITVFIANANGSFEKIKTSSASVPNTSEKENIG